MKIADAILDQLHRLQQKRLAEIDDHGEAVSLVSPSQQLKAIRETATTWHFSPTAPIKPGSVLRHVDCVGSYLVTASEEGAGRLTATLLQLPQSASFYTAAPRAVDLLGRVHYSLTAQGWSSIPCALSGKKIILPGPYLAAKGDIIMIEGREYQVTAAYRDEATAIAEVEEFN